MTIILGVDGFKLYNMVAGYEELCGSQDFSYVEKITKNRCSVAWINVFFSVWNITGC